MSEQGVAILCKDTGELGNRLVTYAYLLGAAAAHRVAAVNLCFWRYAHLFGPAPQRTERPWEAWPPGERPHRSGLLEQGARRLLLSFPGRGLRKHFMFDGEILCAPRTVSARLLNAASARWPRAWARALGLVWREEKAWQHECSLMVSPRLAEARLFDPASVLAIAGWLRARFSLRADLQAQLAEHLRPWRMKYDRLIGIHVRRGDYAVYRGGCWFFEDEKYRRMMWHLMSLLAPARVGFLLASSEPFDPARWAGLPVHAAPGSPVLDMYALAQCNLIAGPPSTFSGWASFMGDTPIYFLQRDEQTPSADELRTTWTPQYY
jgi:hypothetical protein